MSLKNRSAQRKVAYQRAHSALPVAGLKDVRSGAYALRSARNPVHPALPLFRSNAFFSARQVAKQLERDQMIAAVNSGKISRAEAQRKAGFIKNAKACRVIDSWDGSF